MNELNDERACVKNEHPEPDISSSSSHQAGNNRRTHLNIYFRFRRHDIIE